MMEIMLNEGNEILHAIMFSTLMKHNAMKFEHMEVTKWQILFFKLKQNLQMG